MTLRLIFCPILAIIFAQTSAFPSRMDTSVTDFNDGLADYEGGEGYVLIISYLKHHYYIISQLLSHVDLLRLKFPAYACMYVGMQWKPVLRIPVRITVPRIS